MLNNKKVVVVMPAYNAEQTVEKTYNDIPDIVDEVILVDDYSTDNTYELSKSLGIITARHKKNLGYGGNQKTCYKIALENGADIVIMLHPDYQYDATLIPDLIKPIAEERFDIMLGSRIRRRSEALEGGMPLYKYIANRFLTLTENIILDQNLSELHTGLRAYSKEVLLTNNYMKNSNDFVFDSEFLVQSVYNGFSIGEIQVPTKYMPEASSINFRRSCTYGLLTLVTAFKYILQKLDVKEFKIFKKRK